MAALYAELPIKERRNHTLLVGYMAPATDATLAEGHIDLKIENNTANPVLIESVLTCNRHIVNIYGAENRPPERQIAFESVLIEAVAPLDEKVSEDPSLPFGASQIIFPGLDGGKYELYKVITDNGATERIKINTSNYRPLPLMRTIGAEPPPQIIQP